MSKAKAKGSSDVFSEVRAAAAAHGHDGILLHFGFPKEVIEQTSVDHPCQRCNSDTSLRYRSREEGYACCHKCGASNHDIISTVAWWKWGAPISDGDKQLEAAKLIDEYLGAGITSKKAKTSKSSNKRNEKSKADPAANLRFVDQDGRELWNPVLVHLWCLKKPPIKPESLLSVGARMAIYRGQYTVIALPVWGEAGKSADPVGWCLFNTSGNDLPVFGEDGKLGKWKKVKLTAGSESGILGPIDQVADATHVWKTEGPTDLLALLSSEPLEGHTAICNAAGASENPLRKLAWSLELFTGKVGLVVHDADKPGQDGAVGNGPNKPGWAAAIATTAKEARNVQLPYEIKPDHGQDLRDYLQDHSYQQLLELATNAEMISPELDSRVEIEIVSDEYLVNDVAAEAIANDLSIYQRGGQLVKVLPATTTSTGDYLLPTISPIQEALVRESLTRVAKFYRVKIADGEEIQVPAHVPQFTVQAVARRGHWDGIRTIHGVVNHPVIRPDGSILIDAGYDQQTGLYFAPGDQSFLMPDDLSRDAAVDAIEQLKEPYCDFDFQSEAHRAAAITLPLTIISRFAFRGPAPLYIVDASAAGAGKGLNVDTSCAIPFGRTISRTPAPTEDTEIRKVITSVALSGKPVVLFDNLGGTFGFPTFDAALTSSIWSDRMLGRNHQIELELRTIWVLTGNNVLLAADTSRRALHIRLTPKVEDPEERSDFRYPRLIEWTIQNRPRLLKACLTVIAAYCKAGRPDQKLQSWGSYEGWSSLVRSAAVWAGLKDPGLTRRELKRSADREFGAFKALLETWHQIDPDGLGITAASIVSKLEERTDMLHPDQHPAFRNALLEFCPGSKGKLPNPRTLGNRLRKFRERVINGRFLDAITKQNFAFWKVRQVRPSDFGESVSLGESALLTQTHGENGQKRRENDSNSNGRESSESCFNLYGHEGKNTQLHVEVGADAHAYTYRDRAENDSQDSTDSPRSNGHCEHTWKQSSKPESDGHIRRYCSKCVTFGGYLQADGTWSLSKPDLTGSNP